MAEAITIDDVDLEHVPNVVLHAVDRRLNLEVCVLETLQKQAARKLPWIIAAQDANLNADLKANQLPEQVKAERNAQVKATQEYITWRSLMHRRFLLVELQGDLQRESQRRRTGFPWQ